MNVRETGRRRGGGRMAGASIGKYRLIHTLHTHIHLNPGLRWYAD